MDTTTLTQPQREAILDILVLAMYSDGHLSLLEDDNLKAKIDSLNWDPNMSASIYLGESVAAARDTEGMTEVLKAVEEKAKILETPEVKNHAYELAVEMLRCDDIAEDEKEFLSALKYSLGVID